MPRDRPGCSSKKDLPNLLQALRLLFEPIDFFVADAPGPSSSGTRLLEYNEVWRDFDRIFVSVLTA
ncbi:MAG: hypothetical protein ABR555_10690 [Pyrinomonadaceae bacterium]